MAASSTASVSPLTVIASSSVTTKMKAGKVNYVSGLNPFSGLKAQNGTVAVLGIPECTERAFARFVCSLRMQGKGRIGGRGGALSSECNAADEIFRIAAIMNGLVLIGVALGFVLLRIEASLEESD